MIQSALKKAGDRFHVPFRVIELGSGTVYGSISETDQSSQPSYVFVRPRHVFRTPSPTALKIGMTIMSPGGTKFIVGDNGPSETWRGRLWESFRVFEPSGKYAWTRRGKTVDPLTRLPQDNGIPEELGMIYAAIESVDREQVDREMRQYMEQERIITGHPIQHGDLVDNRAVTKVDKQLGLYIGILS
jgi:hypothetical protein